MKKINFTYFCVIICLFMFSSCSNIDKEKVIQCLVEHPLTKEQKEYGYPADFFVIESMKKIKAYDPMLDDNDNNFKIWYDTKYIKNFKLTASKDEIKNVFDTSEANSEAVIVTFHYTANEDKKITAVLFMKDGEFYSMTDLEWIDTVMRRRINLNWDEFEDKLKYLLK